MYSNVNLVGHLMHDVIRLHLDALSCLALQPHRRVCTFVCVYVCVLQRGYEYI